MRGRRSWWWSMLCLLAVSVGGMADAAPNVAPPNTKAPEFSLTSVDGKVKTLKGERGKVVLVNFWATWCGPCRQELPKLQDMYNRLKNEKVTFMVASVDDESTVGGVKGFLQANKLTLPVYLDTNHKAVMPYNPEGVIPFTVLIDHKGNVRYIHQGYEPGEEKLVEQELRALLKEIPAAKAAAPAKKK